MACFKPLLSMLTLASLCFLAMPAHAKPYVVDTAASTISFSGTHAGKPFEGKFNDWHATVDFDPRQLEKSKIEASFKLESAKTGNAMFDGTLPTADWFDVKNTPTATFASTSITQERDGAYKAQGTLTLRGQTVPISLLFTLSDIIKSPITASATLTIDRLAFGIGKQSDPKAEWVSQVIGIKMNIVARALNPE